MLDAVRKACPTALYSTGVKLARDGAVRFEKRDAHEAIARVRVPNRVVPPTVTLYLDEEEWSCDCDGRFDACEHVTAAVIALAQAPVETKTEGEAPREAPSGPAIVYRLRTVDRSLVLTRHLREGEKETEIGPSLTQLVARRRDLAPTHDDLALDRVLAGNARGLVLVAKAAEILGRLSGRELTLDGEPARTSGEPVAPRAIVNDTETGVSLRIERDPSITAVVARGVVRVGELLRPMAETELSGDLLEKLPSKRAFGAAQLGELCTRVLPALESRIEVIVRAHKLPKAVRDAHPRIVLDVAHREEGLSVVPLLVYGDPPVARVDGESLVLLGDSSPTRNRTAEKFLLAKLRDELSLIPGRRVDFKGRDAAVFAGRLQAWSVSDPERALAQERPLTFSLEVDDLRASFDFVVEGDPPRHVAAETVLRAYRDGLPFVAVPGGGLAPLPGPFLEAHGRALEALLAARDAEGVVEKAALPALAELCAALDRPAPPSFARLRPLLEGIAAIPAAALPADLVAELRPYQRQGIDWLCFLREAGLGALLADDMGLGKTLQALAAIRGRTLVVAPKSVVFNWQAELARFRPSLTVATYLGPNRALDPRAQVTLTSHPILRQDEATLAAVKWDLVILDEAQAIKNPQAQLARAAFALSAESRIALSGTPVENRLEELWSLMHFAARGLLGGLSDFRARYVGPISSGDEAIAAELRARVRPFLLRRTKAQVAIDLPPRTEIVVSVELEPEERTVYDAVRAATRKDVVERLRQGGDVLAALEALLRLRQAACHRGLVPGQQADTSSKVERLAELVAEASAEGHKCLVFSQWTSLLDRVEPHLSVPFARLDGSTKDRAAVVERFQTDPDVPVLLLSLKAGGVGLNLTAADHVFLLDPWWNPAAEDQAADRAHRIGQDRPVLVHRLVAKGTVEEGILALQESKRRLAAAALSEGAAAATLGRDELLALLEL
ncbi:MAG: DEAD/DEAH box helicase [Myxococcales bacterium]|nr:DEAD/DEAH box helicase [Myxococcales bacterium]